MQWKPNANAVGTKCEANVTVNAIGVKCDANGGELRGKGE